MITLGINLSHEASVAVVKDGQLKLSCETGRLTRIKRDTSIEAPLQLIKDSFFDEIGFSFPQMRNEKEVQSFQSLVTSLLDKNNIKFKNITSYQDHHALHAFSSFYNSGFKEAICVVADGGGNYYKHKNIDLGYEIFSIYKITHNSYECIYKLCKNLNGEFHHFGHVHSVPTLSLGEMFSFVQWGYDMAEPGSVMGLSCYGSNNSYKSLFIKDNYFISNPAFLQRVMMKWSPKEDNCKIIQRDTCEVIKHFLNIVNKEYSKPNICLSGGYFQNVMTNYEILKLDNKIFVDPIAHDGGTSIGIAQHLYVNRTNKPVQPYKNLFLGPKYNIKEMFDNTNFSHTDFEIIKKESNIDDIANLLSDNKSVAIFQGRSEIGPRALGNRSILFNPNNPKGKEIVNLIKKREWYRPYAGTVLYEHKDEWFDFHGRDNTKYMSFAVDVKEDKKNTIPAITHIDGTCRVQTIKKEENEMFYNIIEKFYKKTSIPILLNTSLNIKGEPLVENIKDLISFLTKTKIDYVYIVDLNLLLYKNVSNKR